MQPQTITRSPEVTTADLLKRLEQGIEETRASEGFQAFLRACARFHNYSFANTLLIMLQRPGATRVAGFQTWKHLGRYVRKGEKGIRILAPIVRRVEADSEEEPSQRTVVHYKAVSVFDVSQTDGGDLPEPVTELAGNDHGVYEALEAVAFHAGLIIDRREDASADAQGINGYYIREQRRIWVNPELEPLQAAKTLAHELSHHYADHPAGDCRGERETVAEASAFVVMASFGVDSGSYSFGYLASWADTATFKAKLAEIQRTAGAILDVLEGVRDSAWDGSHASYTKPSGGPRGMGGAPARAPPRPPGMERQACCCPAGRFVLWASHRGGDAATASRPQGRPRWRDGRHRQDPEA
jgi:antirestriction protein ArdC